MLSTIVYETVDFIHSLSRLAYKTIGILVSLYSGTNKIEILEKRILDLENNNKHCDNIV